MTHKNTGKIMTMLGPKDPEKLGHILPHEHLYFNTSGNLPVMDDEKERFYNSPITLENLNFVRKNPYSILENCFLFDAEVLRRAIKEFKQCGGGTICDVTPHGCNLDSNFTHFLPEIKKVTAEESVDIVLGFGHYVQSKDDDEPNTNKNGRFLDSKYNLLISPGSAAVVKMNDEELAKQYIQVIDEGFGDTGIFPGVIGELGTGFVVTELEQRTLRAGAIAQQETGLPITLHLQPSKMTGHQVLDVLEAAGARMDKIVLGHRDGVLAIPGMTIEKSVDLYLSLLDRGCYIQFDTCGNQEYFRNELGNWWLPTDRERATALKVLVDHGFGDKLLLSHDVAHRYCMTEFGGWGYGHVLTGFRETMLEYGLSENDCDKMTKFNPQKMLTIF